MNQGNQVRGTKVPPETPSFYDVFDINHYIDIKLFSSKGGVSGEP
jgi:hypothetical protein